MKQHEVVKVLDLLQWIAMSMDRIARALENGTFLEDPVWVSVKEKKDA